MGNMVDMNLTKDIFTLVAPDVTSGLLHLVAPVGANILYTYIHPSGGAAPADDASLGVPAFVNTTVEQISFKSGADVYLMPVGKDIDIKVAI